MNDDLNTPIVISHLFDAAKQINSIASGTLTIDADGLAELKDTFHTFMFDVLGLKEQRDGDDKSLKAFSGAVDMLLDIRGQAKAEKNWALSDRIRNELTQLGFTIKDTKDGVEWKL